MRCDVQTTTNNETRSSPISSSQSQTARARVGWRFTARVTMGQSTSWLNVLSHGFLQGSTHFKPDQRSSLPQQHVTAVGVGQQEQPVLALRI